MIKTQSYGPDCGAVTLCQTDNAELSVFIESSIPFSRRFLISQALSDFNNNSDLTVQFPALPTYTGGSETDVVYRVAAPEVPASAAAITVCGDPIDSVRDQQDVNYGTGDLVTLWRSCHETGHAVGLTHGSEAFPVLDKSDPRLWCMITATQSGAQPVLGYNSGDNINETY